MNILIIGNGFDLACKYPTRYKDFLAFIGESKDLYSRFFKSIHENVSQNLPKKYEDLSDINNYKGLDWAGIDSIFSQVREDCKAIFLKIARSYNLSEVELAQSIFSNIEFREYNAKLLWLFTHGCVWIDYFMQYSKVDGNWIDFEAEIHRVILTLLGNDAKDMQDECLDQLGIDSSLPLLEIFDILKSEFLRLKDYIEVYFIILDQAAKLAKSKGVFIPVLLGIEHLKPDKLISFNYTHISNTTCYGHKEVNYVHGEAGKHNLVLGMDDEALNNHPFAKLFTKQQQIEDYKIPQLYTSWLANNIDGNFEVHVYGSSLSIFDKHIFAPIFTHPCMEKCTIYYKGNENEIRDNIQKIIGARITAKNFQLINI